MFDFPKSLKEAAAVQRELVGRLRHVPLGKDVRLVAGADISCVRGDPRLFAAVVVLAFPSMECVECVEVVGEATFPYISGFLAFREVPLVLQAFEKLEKRPDVVLCDGQGIAHPRGLGLAAHLGLCLGLPTVGCAKTRLVGTHGELGKEKGEQEPLIYKERQVGVVLRTRSNVKPLYISPGHLIDIESSVQIVEGCVGKTRLPEPTRQAHLRVNAFRKSCC